MAGLLLHIGRGNNLAGEGAGTMGHGCRICQSVAVGTAVGSGSSHPAVVSVRKTNSPPNHTEGRPTIFCVNSHPSRTATPSRRHPQGAHSGPDYLDHPYQVGSTIHTILSFDPGAPPNCFGRRLRSSSVRQPPLLAQIDPRQPQLIIGTLCAQELPDGSEKIAAADVEGRPYVVELFGRRQQVFQVQD